MTHVDSGSHLRQMLSQAHNRTSQSHTATTQVVDSTTPQQIAYNGHTYTQMHAKLEYRVSQHNHSHSGSLIDGGANGGMSGNDVRVLSGIQS